MGAKQTLDGVEGQDLPPVDDRDAIAEALRLLHVVGGVDDRPSQPLQRFDVVEDEISRLRVHADGRLVEEDHGRVVENAADEVETALHPAGVGRDAILPARGEPREFEGHLDPRLPDVGAQVVELSEELEVLLGGQVLIERDRLRRDADLGSHRGPRRVGLAVEAHLA